MMEKAGYLQRTGYSALDSEGNVHAVIELHILGTRYAIRRSDLSKAVSGHVFIQLEELTHQWQQYYLGAVKGLAQVSVSGKALNLELFDTGNFTVSLNSLRGVMYGKERLATIGKIPAQSAISARRGVYGQQQISAVV
ncbi:MAG: hypothetical protein Q7U51_07875 [Methanoregula sp.]|nr:hypothetical protein [Methanoregula sp.]